MQVYVELLAMLPVLVICYQFYVYAATGQGVERQQRSRDLGIVYMAIGMTSLITRKPAVVFVGLILIMMGFRLIARGLDRLDKKVFIDRYDGHNNGSEPKEKEKGA